MVAWTEVKTREPEKVDNSGYILNIKSRGLGDQLCLKSRHKKKIKKIKDNSLSGVHHYEATYWDGKTQKKQDCNEK